MAFNIDPATLIGNALADVVQRSIIIGMPSDTAPIPNFILCEIPEEGADTSVSLSAFQVAPGDLSSKSAVNSGEYHIMIALSDDDTTPATWFTAVTTALAAITGGLNSLLSFGGGIIPNLSAITSSYVGGQLAALTAMKNNRQPITILQAYINLGTISQTSPYLESQWFIEKMNIMAAEGEQGCIVNLSLKEQLKKRNAAFTSANLLKNLAGELLGPLGGGALGAIL